VLKLQRSSDAVSLSDDYNEWRTKADDFEIFGKLRGIPDFAVCGFEGLAGLRMGIDIGDERAPH
jgi:hypothetical protein